MTLTNKPQTKPDIWSVTELNRRVKSLLEGHYNTIWISGEISNLARPSSGHWYFTLKDAAAQVRCAMFRGRNRLVKFALDHGSKVVVRAQVSLYEGRGDYQLIVEHIEQQGKGDLQQQFEQLKAKLLAEGLFDDEYKQELPYIPERIGIITSPTGAAIHDMLNVLQRRFPMVPVLLFPVAVQGDGAAREIAENIALANELQNCDLLIVGRGGGSLEDLWAFNEEVVARSIYASHIPIISAVGHEVDFTIADFVADVRAATPSAAAELAVPDQADMHEYVRQLGLKLGGLVLQHIGQQKQEIAHLAKRLQSPMALLRQRSQRLDHLEFRLKNAIDASLKQEKARLSLAHKTLDKLNPVSRIEFVKQQLAALQQSLYQSVTYKLEQARSTLEYRKQLLHNLSPLNTLQRGYAIATNAEGEVITDSAQAALDEQVKLRLAKGQLICKTVEILQAED